jgi:hypothetical protein
MLPGQLSMADETGAPQWVDIGMNLRPAHLDFLRMLEDYAALPPSQACQALVDRAMGREAAVAQLDALALGNHFRLLRRLKRRADANREKWQTVTVTLQADQLAELERRARAERSSTSRMMRHLVGDLFEERLLADDHRSRARVLLDRLNSPWGYAFVAAAALAAGLLIAVALSQPDRPAVSQEDILRSLEELEELEREAAQQRDSSSAETP